MFELDAPGNSGAHALGLPPLGAAAPANDVAGAKAKEAANPAGLAIGGPLTGDRNRDSQLIDAEFAALAQTGELDAPVLAAVAAEVAAHGRTAGTARYDTRALTHVPAELDFDTTLKLPRSSDTVEARRGRLAVRYKAACVAYKIQITFQVSSSERKELVELFSAYESGLRAALPPAAASEPKRDADHLHSLLPAPGLDELERTLAKIEERLLALDDGVPEDDFREAVTKAKHPLKAILRYARVLASKRFNIGYRRDRFEYLAVELLTNQTADKQLRLLPRDKAAMALQHLLAGLPQSAAPEERAPAIAHMREALDRLAAISSAKEFFDSEFFLDLHGYKISMRDQITCPEFLYLCVAVHVEIHNRLLAWSRSGNPSHASLLDQLEAQQATAEEVFTNFKRPRSTPAPKSPPPAAPAPQAPAVGKGQPQPIPPRRKRKPRKAAVSDPPEARVKFWAKLGGLALVAMLTTTTALYSAGVFRWTEPPAALTLGELRALSPLFVRATVSRENNRFEGMVSRGGWQKLSRAERRALAQELALKLKNKGIPNGRVLAYKTPVMQIEFSTVVFVDESSPPPVQ